MSTTSSVTTNINDYAPGATAVITATGFDPGSEVRFEVDHVSGAGADGVFGTIDDVIIEMGGAGHDAWYVVDGSSGDLDGLANGTVVTTWYVNPDDSEGERFLLTASTTAGWFASNTFTDAKPVTGFGTPASPNNPGGAFVETFLVSSTAGTGVIQSVVKIGSNDVFEQGYNSDFRPTQFDEESTANFNRSIQLSQINLVEINNVDYREFDLDLNESNGGTDPLITLHNVMIFASTQANLTGLDLDTLSFSNGSATLLYNMDQLSDQDTTLTDWNAGSGTGDYAFFIPVEGIGTLPGFVGVSETAYIYIYSEFGTKDGEGSSVSGGFEEWFVVTAPNPSLLIDKTASVSGDVVDAAGDVIQYTLLVSNGGNVNLTGVTVTDPYADINSILRGTDVAGDNDNILEIGEIWSYTATHTVTQAEIDSYGGGDGFLENTASADSNETEIVADTASVPIDQNKSLQIEKDADLTVVDTVGQTITYTYVVTNTGNAAIGDVEVMDDNATPGDTSDDFELTLLGGDTDTDGMLDVDEAWSYESMRDVTQAMLDDGSAIVNVATATGEEAEPDSDDATVTVDQNPGISLNKVTVYGAISGDGLTGITSGDSIGWRYTVTNTGNAALSNVLVSDDNGTPGNLLDDFTPVYASGDTDTDGKLDVDETWTFTASGTALTGTYTNLGTVSGISADGQAVNAADTSSYTVIDREALIAPTGTTPYQYISGTALTFQEYYDYQGGVIQYSVKGGKINQTNPGVFFYFTGASGDIVGTDDGDADTNAEVMTVTVDQSRTGGTTSAFLPLNNSNIQLYKVNDLNSNGEVDAGDSLTTIKLNNNQISVNADGDVSVTFTPDAVGSMYVVSVKYQTSAVVGNTVGTNPGDWPTVNYNFDTVLNGDIIETYEGGVDLAPKPSSPMLLAGEGGDGANAINTHQMKSLVNAAIAFWAAQGEDVEALHDASIEVADLGMDGDHWILGLTQGSNIMIDDDGAGLGWSVGVGGVAPDRVDLLSVLVHEMGHVLGMSDEDLGDMLAAGDRMLPVSGTGAGDAIASLPLSAQLLGAIGVQEAEQHVNFS